MYMTNIAKCMVI